MAGEAPDVGDVLLGAVGGIFTALAGGTPPVQKPIPVAPSIARPGALPTSTLILIGIGAFVLVQLMK